MANDTILKQFLQLRVLVGFLGEKHESKWWDTSCLDSTGQQFLQIAFPRSALSAGVNSVTEAARKLHDSRIGATGVYHLFRLPVGMEESLHRALLEMDAPGLRELKELISDRDTALARLRELGQDLVTAPEGPVQIGTEKTLFWKTSVEELAKHYYDAFTHDRQVLPYFSKS